MRLESIFDAVGHLVKGVTLGLPLCQFLISNLQDEVSFDVRTYWLVGVLLLLSCLGRIHVGTVAASILTGVERGTVGRNVEPEALIGRLISPTVYVGNWM